jgi:hypothetical protein
VKPRTIILLGVIAGFAGCVRAHAQAMPDRKLTPGATSGRTAKQLCDPKFHTGTVRAVSESEKNKVYAEYSMVPHRGACAPAGCEVDHLISLELGGSNDIANLWPEPYAPAPNAHQKDLVENWLHRQVCSGAIPLAEAQHQISTDWFAVYRRMSRDDDNAVKNAR